MQTTVDHPRTSPHPGPLPGGEGGTSRAVDGATAELQYAPRPPLRRRRVVRRVLLLLSLTVVVVAGVKWFPRVREHVMLQVWQRRCLSYTPPVGEVVYDGDPQRAAALLARDGRYQKMPGSTAGAFLVQPAWSNLYATLSPPGLRSHGTVFLGTLRTPDGEDRLVGIDMVVQGGAPDAVMVTARSVEPGSLLRRPRVVASTSTEFLNYGIRGMTVTPATADPNDPTHVALFGGKVDARVLKDGSVSLRPFDPGTIHVWARGAVTRPAPSSPASLPTSAGPATRPSGGPGGR